MSKGSALDVKGLNVYYGQSHALQGVDLGLEAGVLSVVGRNGMGKTTLCKAIMGLEPASAGAISLYGQSLVGKSPADIARLGIGYVPQGRHLWKSLPCFLGWRKENSMAVDSSLAANNRCWPLGVHCY